MVVLVAFALYTLIGNLSRSQENRKEYSSAVGDEKPPDVNTTTPGKHDVFGARRLFVNNTDLNQETNYTSLANATHA